MAAPQPFDPGFTRQYAGNLSRAINKDGTFNVLRRGMKWYQENLYLNLIDMRWRHFFAIVLLFYLVENIVFATIYVQLGVENLVGANPRENGMNDFMHAFFFSSQTVTTVGYGHISPRGLAVSSVAALEAMIGLMSFALITGLLYGRVSRPSARVIFSHSAIIAPYENGESIQFRIANQRSNNLMEPEVSVILMTVEPVDGVLKRKFSELSLERRRISMFPLTWTVVHPITDSSPMHRLEKEDLERLQAELIILLKAFDDTFSQTVHARYSYRHEEVVWGAKFKPTFHINSDGDMVLDLDHLHDIEHVERG